MTQTALSERFNRRMLAAFMVLVVGIVTVFGLVVERYNALLGAQASSIHTYQVLDGLREIEVVLRRDRGLPYCAVTGDHSFIGTLPVDRDFQELHSKLVELTRNKPQQQLRLNRLGDIWQEWQHGYVAPLQSWCDQPAGFARPGRAQLAPVEKKGAALRDDIRQTLKSLRDTENQLLVIRQAESQQLQTITARLAALGGTFMGLQAIWLVLYVMRTTSRLRLLNKSLQVEIEERERASREIERFKDVLDNTLDMIFMFDPATLQIRYVNRGMVETLGYSHAEMKGMEVYRLEASTSEALCRERISPLLSGEQPSLRHEAMFRAKSGGELAVEVFLQHVHGDEQNLFVGIARDLTERHRLDLIKRNFISTVSHELRTPLTSIRGALSLLAGGATGELQGQTKRMIDIANHNSERLVLLINDILDVEKIESGHMRFDSRRVDLEPLVRQAVLANEEYVAQYEVTIELHIGEISAVRADPDRVLQIMANLLSNAAKYSHRHGKIEVTLGRVRAGFVRVAVRDHGEGIPEEFRSRIFRKFSQADASNTRQKGGTGLGLSICQALVHRMGGTIDFGSRPGEGAEFWFELPEWALNT